jgi:hypothetical protein
MAEKESWVRDSSRTTVSESPGSSSRVAAAEPHVAFMSQFHLARQIRRKYSEPVE